jgi:hypothetical protein
VLGEVGFEVGEDVELGLERVGRVQVELVPAAPSEGLAWAPDQPGEIDPARAEELHVLRREVLADDRHDPRRQEVAGAGGK